MQIRNRLFSYPVYSSDVDDYKSNTFTFDYNAESNGDTVLIQYTTTISNKHILKKLNNLTIKLALMIECAKTAYRNLFV